MNVATGVCKRWSRIAINCVCFAVHHSCAVPTTHYTMAFFAFKAAVHCAPIRTWKSNHCFLIKIEHISFCSFQYFIFSLKKNKPQICNLFNENCLLLSKRQKSYFNQKLTSLDIFVILVRKQNIVINEGSWISITINCKVNRLVII